MAGHDPERAGRLAYRGRVGRSLSLADARAALRLATLNALASARASVGPLAGVRCVVLTGFVVSDAPRGLDPAVLEESLRLLAAVLPAATPPAVWLRPARGLAGGMPVEVELLLERRSRRSATAGRGQPRADAAPPRRGGRRSRDSAIRGPYQLSSLPSTR